MQHTVKVVVTMKSKEYSVEVKLCLTGRKHIAAAGCAVTMKRKVYSIWLNLWPQQEYSKLKKVASTNNKNASYTKKQNKNKKIPQGKTRHTINYDYSNMKRLNHTLKITFAMEMSIQNVWSVKRKDENMMYSEKYAYSNKGKNVA